MFESDSKWHHDYPRLAFDTGFQFEKLKSENFDKHKLRSVDVSRLIEERDFASIEKLIPNVLKFILDPEQTKLLDESFVKTFFISQLIIQYLLYCKKYLDKSLIILKADYRKLKEENSELNHFVEDLQAHISQLVQRIEEKPTFRCTQCNKIFSTEDFLNSHMKRRHSEIETEKIEMEIKELKGRLNSAEKLIQKDTSEITSKETELKKLEELQAKFEELRLQVQAEMKVLQSQNYLQEKYDKLFEKMALGEGGVAARRESSTQTDLDGGELQIGEEHSIRPEIQKALENKVASSLEKIESQMQTFWSKLNEMEQYRGDEKDTKPIRTKSKFHLKEVEQVRIEDSSQIREEKVIETRSKHQVEDLEVKFQNETLRQFSEDEEPIKSENHLHLQKADLEQVQTEDSSAISEKEVEPQIVKPRSRFQLEQTAQEKVELKPIKPRSKFQLKDIEPKPSLEQIASESSSSISKERVARKPIRARSNVQVKEAKSEKQPSLTASEEETESSETETEVSEAVPQPTPTYRKPPQSSLGKKLIDAELLNRFRLEIETILKNRLQDLGVSPDWKGLPTRSFQRALEIITHQANLTKKTYPRFEHISSHIESTITKKLQESKPQKLEIKNRKIYATDSDDDEVKPVSAPYKAVIEELKLVNSNKAQNEETKGVLKSFPSVASLTKKKVLFKLNDQIDTGSTTSVASSVFDATPRRDPKEIEDLSDFDFSQM